MDGSIAKTESCGCPSTAPWSCFSSEACLHVQPARPKRERLRKKEILQRITPNPEVRCDEIAACTPVDSRIRVSFGLVCHALCTRSAGRQTGAGCGRTPSAAARRRTGSETRQLHSPRSHFSRRARPSGGAAAIFWTKARHPDARVLPMSDVVHRGAERPSAQRTRIVFRDRQGFHDCDREY